MNPIQTQFHIQSEVRVSEVLESFINQQEHFYLCYTVAKLLKDQLKKIPGFLEFSQYEESNTEGIYYAFLLNRDAAESLCTTVVRHFNLQINEAFPDVETDPTMFPYAVLRCYDCYGSSYDGFSEWNKTTRINMLKFVLAKDPDAVISVNLVIEDK